MEELLPQGAGGPFIQWQDRGQRETLFRARVDRARGATQALEGGLEACLRPAKTAGKSAGQDAAPGGIDVGIMNQDGLAFCKPVAGQAGGSLEAMQAGGIGQENLASTSIVGASFWVRQIRIASVQRDNSL